MKKMVRRMRQIVYLWVPLQKKLLDCKDKVLIIHECVAEHVSAVPLMQGEKQKTHTNEETD